MNRRPSHREPPPSEKASFTWNKGLQTEQRPHAEDSSHAPQLCFRSSFLPCTAPVALCSEHRGSHVTLTWGRSPPKPHTGVGGQPQAGFPSRPGSLGARASIARRPLPGRLPGMVHRKRGHCVSSTIASACLWLFHCHPERGACGIFSSETELSLPALLPVLRSGFVKEPQHFLSVGIKHASCPKTFHVCPWHARSGQVAGKPSGGVCLPALAHPLHEASDLGHTNGCCVKMSKIEQPVNCLKS